MADTTNLANIPEIINGFNVYKGGNVLVGISGAVSLPNFESITEEISGAGILGSYETSTPGQYGSITQDIPFRIFDKDAFGLVKPNGLVDLTLRASVQSTVRSTGALDYKGMRIVELGRFKSLTSGKVEQGKQMDTVLSFELIYIMIELDGNKMLEYDKLNSVFVINGEDLLAKIKSLT